MSYMQPDRGLSGTFSVSSASPPAGAGSSFAASPPPGALGGGPGSVAGRPRKIAWCPGPRLFPAGQREDTEDDFDDASDASASEDASSDGGDGRLRASVAARDRKCAGFFIVGLPELKLYEYLGSVGCVGCVGGVLVASDGNPHRLSDLSTFRGLAFRI